MARLNQNMLKEFWSRQQAVLNIPFGGDWGVLLECDFLITIERPSIQPLTSSDWILSSLDVKGAQLSWTPDDGLFGWPMPKVSASVCSLTFLTKSKAPLFGGDYSVGDLLKKFYEAQFSPQTGLLKVPRKNEQTTITFQVKGTLKGDNARTVYRGDNVDGLYPYALFQLTGVRFGTPTFTQNPTTLNAMAITVPFAYRNTVWRDFSDETSSRGMYANAECDQDSLLTQDQTSKPLYLK